MLNSLTERVGDPEKGQLEDLRHMKNMVFVITGEEPTLTYSERMCQRRIKQLLHCHSVLLLARHSRVVPSSLTVTRIPCYLINVT